jgi:hypothetical protein
VSKTTGPGRPGFVERRRRPREPGETANWEQRAIQRVVGRVKALPVESASGPEKGQPAAPDEGANADFGWEQAVLERLRRRLDGG